MTVVSHFATLELSGMNWTNRIAYYNCASKFHFLGIKSKINTYIIK